MIQSINKIIRYGLVNPKIAHSPHEYRGDNKLNLYPIVGLRQTKLGAFMLNNPNNRNILTEEFVDEFFRFLSSYHHDHTIENIWLQNKGINWSGGADYSALCNSQQYLRKLYEMTIQLSQLNKPIIARIGGGVRGIASYLLTMITMPLTDSNSWLMIDQTSRGFIPICGGSHRLNKLPADIGMYLALTGEKINAEEMGRLGFIKGTVPSTVSSNSIRKSLNQANLYFRNPHNTQMNQGKREVQLISQLWRKKHNYEQQLKISQSQIFNQKKNFFTKFALHQYRIAKVDYQNAVNPYNSFSENEELQINNYYQMRIMRPLQYLKNKGLIELNQYSHLRPVQLRLDKILPIFSQNSLSDLLSRLKEDNSKWGQQTYNKLMTKDPLSLYLTFELLKRTKDMAFMQAMQLQYRVAYRLLKISKNILKETGYGSKTVLINPFSNLSLRQIKYEQIDSFFKPATHNNQQLEQKIPKISLHPTVDYFHIPDSPRTYLNREFFQDIHQKNTSVEVRRYLEKNKINYRHCCFDPNLLRQAIQNQESRRKQIQKQKQRISYIISKQSLINAYCQPKKQYIQSYDPQLFKQKIQKVLIQCFKQRLQKRFQSLQKTFQIAGKESKMQIFKNTRKILMESIVYNGYQIEQNNTAEHQSFNGLIYFSKQGKGVFDSINPEIENNEAYKALEKQVRQNKQLSKQYSQKYDNVLRQENMGKPSHVDEFQIHRKGWHDKVQQRYDDPANIWYKANLYKQKIQKAAETSEKLSELMNWQVQDLMNVIINAPATQLTYGKFAEDTFKTIRQKQVIQEQEIISILNNLNQLKQKGIFNLLKTSQDLKIRQKYPYVFDETIIPKPLCKSFLGILDEVIFNIMKHQTTTKTIPMMDGSLGFIDNWLNLSNASSFTNDLKPDVEYIFSYLGILQIKEIFQFVHKNGGIFAIKNIIQQLNDKFGLQFEQNTPIEVINKTFSQFLYVLLDIHSIMKQNLRRPESKLLDFMNRLKINLANNQSFESFMLLIAKDRYKLLNKLIIDQKVIQQQPQLSLNWLNKKINSPFALIQKNVNDKQHDEQMNTSSKLFFQHKRDGKKRLIQNFQFYVMLLDNFIQKAVGKQSFICQQILDYKDQLNMLNNLRNLLNHQPNAEEWFQIRIKEIINDILTYRQSLQIKMSYGQLWLFDLEYRQLLTVDSVRDFLMDRMKNQIEMSRLLFTDERIVDRNAERQTDGAQNSQDLYTWIKKQVKNKNAFKRLNNFKLADVVQQQYLFNQNRCTQVQEEFQDKNLQQTIYANVQRLPKQSYKRMIKETFRHQQPEFQSVTSQKIKNENLQFKIRKNSRSKLTNFNPEINLLKQICKQDKQIQQLYEIISRINDL